MKISTSAIVLGTPRLVTWPSNLSQTGLIFGSSLISLSSFRVENSALGPKFPFGALARHPSQAGISSGPCWRGPRRHSPAAAIAHQPHLDTELVTEAMQVYSVGQTTALRCHQSPCHNSAIFGVQVLARPASCVAKRPISANSSARSLPTVPSCPFTQFITSLAFHPCRHSLAPFTAYWLSHHIVTERTGSDRLRFRRRLVFRRSD